MFYPYVAPNNFSESNQIVSLNSSNSPNVRVLKYEYCYDLASKNETFKPISSLSWSYSRNLFDTSSDGLSLTIRSKSSLDENSV